MMPQQSIARLECWRYSVPLREPLTVSQGAHNVREGLLIKCVNAGGISGVGEIAPLSGLHKETLWEAQEQVLSVLPRLIAGEALPPFLFPSVRCGLEMAQQSLEICMSGAASQVKLPLNALVSGAKETLVSRAVAAVSEGYTTLKIKVGRHSVEDDIAHVRSVREAVGYSVPIRLDANRSWSLETALNLGEALADCRIEYIEEPLNNPADIKDFVRKTGIRVALDEMLYSPDHAERERRWDIPDDVLAAYILKPAIIGGIQAATALAKEAAERNLMAVVSSVFETGVALSFYAYLQTHWQNNVHNDRMIACGLDTFKFLADDVLTIPFAAQQGLVSLPDVWAARNDIRYEMLTRLA